MFDAYLDIETTGLSPTYSYITVIGIYLVNETEDRMVQLVGEEVTGDNLIRVLEDVDTLYTYNGSSFDLPFISQYLGVDLTSHFNHRDLMYDCWRSNLYGGFKVVERQLGILRQLTEIDGYDAVLLWRRYCNSHDQDALALLLEYNKEDVMNLKVLRERLGVKQHRV